MQQVIDPSVADESDPSAVIPELDMYQPDNGWRPWPEPCRYDREWLARYRDAQLARIARLDAIARSSIASAHRAHERTRDLDAARQPEDRVALLAPARGPHRVHDDLPHAGGPGLRRPDHRSGRPADGFAVRVPRSLRRQLRTRRSGAHDDRARLALDVVRSVLRGAARRHHAAREDPDADPARNGRLRDPPAWQAREIRDQAGSDDVTYHELAGAPHYLEGHRSHAVEICVDWLRARFP